MSRQVPQVSLKERIAALQQRELGVRSTSPAGPTGSSSNNVGALRDKIAKFEKEGSVPAPRGSFGMGAPPPIENGQSKRRGELYGNRIPSAVKTHLTGERATSPLPSTSRRLASLNLEDAEEDTLKSFRSLSASPPPLQVGDSPRTGQHKPRSPSFTTALDMARRTEGNVDYARSETPLSRDDTPSPGHLSRFSSFASDDTQALFASGETSSDMDATFVNFDSDIAVHTIGDSMFFKYEPVVMEEEHEDLIAGDKQGGFASQRLLESATPSINTTPGNNSSGHRDEVEEAEPGTERNPSIRPSISIFVEEAAGPAVPSTRLSADIPLTTAFDEEPHADSESSETSTSSGTTRPLSTLSNASDPESLFTDTTFLNSKSRNPGIFSEVESFATTPLAESTPIPTPQRPSTLAPVSPHQRAHSMVEPSTLSNGAAGQLPMTSDIDGNGQTHPHTPSPIQHSHLNHTEQQSNESELGALPMHKSSQSLSHPSHYFEPLQSPNMKPQPQARSFNAIVHSKVREVYAETTPSRRPPQMSRVMQSIVEPPPSPGSGELVALLEEAALLERTLINGDLPSETPVAQPIQGAPPPPIVTKVLALPKEPSMPAPKRHKRTFKVPHTLGRRKSGGHNRRESSGYSSSTDSHGIGAEPPSSSFDQGNDLASAPESRSSVPAVPSVPVASERHSFSRLSKLQSTPEDEVPPTPPPKSLPTSRYLGTFKRLTSSKRNSISMSLEMSSDDSMPIVTPGDNKTGIMPMHMPVLHEPEQDAGYDDKTSPGSGGIAWPSVSPRKGATVSRASSFADKIWHRGRAKSSTSMVSTTDEDDHVTLSSAKGSKFDLMRRKLSTPMAPRMSSTVTSPSNIIVPPTRSASLHSRSQSKLDVPPLETLPDISFMRPASASATSSYEKYDAPSTQRPMSWATTASNTSMAPSTIMGEEFFDSFPSVPQDVPTSRPSSIDYQRSTQSRHISAGPGSHPPVSAHNMHALTRTSSAATVRASTESQRHLTTMTLL